MRLINVETRALEVFVGQPPPYAILSHTWGDEEVSYQDCLQPETANRKKGHKKIAETCRLAAENGLFYAWVDTCCIDKASSADLSEAINSMYKWYGNATIAFTHLEDLLLEESDGLESLERCRWFGRGWTLQELIAPLNMEFYDQAWTKIGSKASLLQQLEGITGIPVGILTHQGQLSVLPVANRMSWAANRKTSREEDIAYCLLGIFDVNMPMLYGEGPKAFIRLQEAIMKEVNDLTLFAWTGNEDVPSVVRGIFADHPARFIHGGGIHFNNQVSWTSEFTLTNKGVRLEVGLAGDHDVLSLDCHRSLDGVGFFKRHLGIYIEQKGASTYMRAKADRLAQSSRTWRSSEPRTIYLSKNPFSSSLDFTSAHESGIAIVHRMTSPYFERNWLEPASLWDAKKSAFLTFGVSSFTGAMSFRLSTEPKEAGNAFLLVCGIAPGSRKPWVTIATPRNDYELFREMKDLPRLSELARAKDLKREVQLQDGPWEGTAVVSVELFERTRPDINYRFHVIDIQIDYQEG